MKKYQKIFKALSDTFDITPINSEIDDFETCLNEHELEIVEINLDNNKPLPCPWCGALPVYSQYRKSDKWYILYCSSDKCPIRPRIEDFSKKKLIERWNARPNLENRYEETMQNVF